MSSIALSHFELHGMKPLSVSVKTARALLGVGNTMMWELIKEKRVETITVGRKRLVVYASLEKLIERPRVMDGREN